MNKRYMDVSSIYTTGTVPPSMSSGMVSTTAPSNHLEVRGSLKIKDQELRAGDIKELKMMLEFLRHAITADPKLRELWIAYQAKEKILR
jgi:hypothetical protein